jgi:F-type H+-transporting ATPase subunit b
MLEINSWLFVQIVNFIVLLIILNKILYQPFFRLFKEREDNTKGALAAAKEMDEEKDRLLEQINAKLSGARNEARRIFEELSKEGMDIQRKTLEETQNRAVEMNRKARAELEEAAEQARARLQADIEAISQQIVEKLVGAR